MRTSAMRIAIFTLTVMALTSSASAGIYPGNGCGCIHPCLPEILR